MLFCFDAQHLDGMKEWADNGEVVSFSESVLVVGVAEEQFNSFHSQWGRVALWKIGCRTERGDGDRGVGLSTLSHSSVAGGQVSLIQRLSYCLVFSPVNHGGLHFLAQNCDAPHGSGYNNGALYLFDKKVYKFPGAVDGGRGVPYRRRSWMLRLFLVVCTKQ